MGAPDDTDELSDTRALLKQWPLLVVAVGAPLSWYKMGTRTMRWLAAAAAMLAAILAASSSAASWRFHLLRRFWNQIFT